MSRGALLTLGVAALFGTFAFILIGLNLGNDLPAGATPFYVMAAICGIVAWVCLARRRQQQPTTPQPQEISDTAPERTHSGMNLDLSKLTLSGWLLLLSTFGIVIRFGVIFAHLFPEGVEGPATRKVIGGVGFALAAGFFIGGQVVLKKLGLPILRSNKDLKS